MILTEFSNKVTKEVSKKEFRDIFILSKVIDKLFNDYHWDFKSQFVVSNIVTTIFENIYFQFKVVLKV